MSKSFDSLHSELHQLRPQTFQGYHLGLYKKNNPSFIKIASRLKAAKHTWWKEISKKYERSKVVQAAENN